ncbi:MAG: hypothetical protein IID06_00350 [Gemmatimonadetes bacterium]|nr:hypothetical protein [Gemmatimonadota bacterium]
MLGSRTCGDLLGFAGLQDRIEPKVLRLRTGPLKPEREARNAAIFTHGIASVIGTKVFMARHEAADHDFVAAWVENGESSFCAVQLKELVPKDLNPNATLDELILSLAKYSRTDTVVAILLNRPVQMGLTPRQVASVPFSQLWLFWQASPDGRRWAIQGDVLTTPVRYDFSYPE